MVNTTIFLTPPEALFRKCLLECRDSMQSTKGMEGLVLRWTGGWVRDKLLGVPSHDIDVALSSMTGSDFGIALQAFMKTHGQQYEDEAKAQNFEANLRGIHTIAANPEKSKHLETITTKMFGIDVDFVNLRKEVYDENSRNPQMEFGTAEEDASRRDATVNAMFYNLDTQQVEDLTGSGLTDMANGILRTPLPAYQTFKDDPLRVLRLIRFACRLHYSIENEAQQAMKDKTIHEALQLKISRERVGIEIMKIFEGPDPYGGMKWIIDLDLFATVFADPTNQGSPSASEAAAAFDDLRDLIENKDAISTALQIEDSISLSWFLAAYVPWRGDAKQAVVAAREGIKAANTMSKVLESSIKNRASIQKAIGSINDGTPTRSAIGMIMRACKADWRSQVLYALLCDLEEAGAEQANKQNGLKRFEKFLTYLKDQKLEDAAGIDKKRVLNGNEMKKELGVTKAGPWITTALEMVTEWQFDNEDTATKEGAIEMIKSRRAELKID